MAHELLHNGRVLARIEDGESFNIALGTTSLIVRRDGDTYTVWAWGLPLNALERLARLDAAPSSFKDDGTYYGNDIPWELAKEFQLVR